LFQSSASTSIWRSNEKSLALSCSIRRPKGASQPQCVETTSSASPTIQGQRGARRRACLYGHLAVSHALLPAVPRSRRHAAVATTVSAQARRVNLPTSQRQLLAPLDSAQMACQARPRPKLARGSVANEPTSFGRKELSRLSIEIFSVARTSLERRIRHGSSRGTCGCLTRFAARSTQRLTARLRRSIAFNKYRHDPSAGRTLSFGWRRYAQLSFLDPKRKIYCDPGAHPGMVLRCPGVNARRWVIADWIPCRAKKEQPSSANRSSM